MRKLDEYKLMIDGQFIFAQDVLDELARLRRTLDALLEDVASNPHTAVEMARSYLDQAD